MLVPESENEVIVYDALEKLKHLCLNDLSKIPETLVDIMTDRANSPQDRIQAAGMMTHILALNSEAANNMQIPTIKMQLIGKNSK